uniref:Uncharacterized protein n=1 Tax=Oryza brachyantha TaxID=4533 RepID=J3N861_ORYBR
MAPRLRIGRVGLTVRFVFSVALVAMATAAVLTGGLVAAAPNGLSYKTVIRSNAACSGSCVPGRSNLPRRDCLKIYHCH